MTYFATLSTNITDQIILFGLIAAYSVIGVLIMIGCALLSNYIFKLNMKKELLDEHNMAFGVMLAGLFIAIAIIVAASIIG
jgi:putative membrane protein